MNDRIGADVRPLETGAQLLLVEDDRLVLATVAQGLRAAGFRVESCESVEEAQEWLSGGVRPAIVLLDMCLPGENGLFLAQRLRDLDRVPFIVFSAYGEPEYVERAAALGALAYLVKPLDVAQLIPTLQTCLVRAGELDALRMENQNLQSVLDADRDINVAIGLTMAYHRLKREQAFAQLRQTARGQRRKLVDVARQLIASALVQ